MDFWVIVEVAMAAGMGWTVGVALTMAGVKLITWFLGGGD